MLYQSQYVWFVFVAALDIILTWTILGLGGREVNALADAVIRYRGLPGLILYKFSLTIFVIVMCEFIGRRKPATGKALSE